MAHKLNLYGITVADIRDSYPDEEGADCSNIHPMLSLIGVGIHHDAVDFQPGDKNYNGTTLDEDITRLGAIYDYNLHRLGGFPYPFVASPNGRLWYCRSIETWGAHIAGRNNVLGGIAIMGDYSKKEPSVEALCAVSLGCIIYWRAIGGLRAVQGHTDWALTSDPTVCPGSLRGIWLPKVLQFAAINAKIYPAVP